MLRVKIFMIENLKVCVIIQKNNNIEKLTQKPRLCEQEWSTVHIRRVCVVCLTTRSLAGMPGQKTSSFLDCGREYSGEYVSTSTSTYVRSQRTAVFGHALASVIRDAVL